MNYTNVRHKIWRDVAALQYQKQRNVTVIRGRKTVIRGRNRVSAICSKCADMRFGFIYIYILAR